jgi:hypothetical protein
VGHHHVNIVKLAQHHRLAPGALLHDVLDGIITHVVQVSAKKNLVPFIKFASDLFQIEVSHPYTHATNKFTLHVPMVSNSNLLNLYEFLPLPIHFNFAANLSITLDITAMNLLAIGHSQSLFSAPTYTEGDRNKFKKILPRGTTHGQLAINPKQLPFQNC